MRQILVGKELSSLILFPFPFRQICMLYDFSKPGNILEAISEIYVWILSLYEQMNLQCDCILS